MGLRPVQMAGRLGLTLTDYRALEAGGLHIDYELYLRITDVCGRLVIVPGTRGNAT